MKNKLNKVNVFLKNNMWFVFILIPLLFISSSLDNDFWFTINHGRHIVKSGFTDIEPFTVHDGLSFSFEKWLTCVLFYGIYTFFGGSGMYYFDVFMAFMINLVLYLNLFLITKKKGFSIGVAALVGTWMSLFFIVTRPQIFSYLILLIEFLTLENWKQTKKDEYLFILPILSFLYMQFHSTMWAFFFIIMMPFLFDFNFISSKLKFKQIDDNKRKLSLYCGLSFLVGILNPYGYHSMFYLFKSFGVFDIGIKELETPELGTFCFICFPFLVIALFSFVKMYKNKSFSIPLRAFYMFAGTLVLSIYASRNIAYLLLFGTLSCSYVFENTESTVKETKSMRVGLLESIFVAVIFIFCVVGIKPEKDDFYNKTQGYEILNKLNERTGENYFSNKKIKVFTNFDYGSYAEWLGYRCYMDPRAEVFAKSINKKDDILLEYKKINNDEISYEVLQDKYDFDYWLVKKDKVLFDKLNKDSNYTDFVETDEFVVFKYVH